MAETQQLQQVISCIVDSRKNDAGASIRLHCHDTLVEKYDTISLVWTQMFCKMWIDNDVNDRQTSNIMLPLTQTSLLLYYVNTTVLRQYYCTTSILL